MRRLLPYYYLARNTMSMISPKVDLAFKKIFGVEENKDLLISLINSIVSESDKVADITLLNPYNFQDFQNDKLSILDIKAKGVDGKRFNIEIQILDEADYDKRALYYWAKMYIEQLKKGDPYSLLSKAIGIHILNFTSIVNSPKYHNVFHITEKECHFFYFSDLELHTLELKKFEGSTSQEITDLVSKIKTSLDVWMAFLTRHQLLTPDNLPTFLNHEELRKAITVLDVMNLNEAEREAYEDRLKWLLMEASALEKLEKETMQKGVQIGIEKMAIEMLNKQIGLDLIIAITGLSKDKILSLQKSQSQTTPDSLCPALLGSR